MSTTEHGFHIEKTVECQHCSQRFSEYEDHCPSCEHETPTVPVSEYIHHYPKWMIDNCTSLEEIADTYDAHADELEKLKQQGWEVTDLTPDGHLSLHREVG